MGCAMALETWQKLSDIALKGVAASAIAAGSVYLAFQKNQLDWGETCSAMYVKLYDAPRADAGAALEAVQGKVNKLVELYEKTCGALDRTKHQFLLANVPSPPPPGNTGFDLDFDVWGQVRPQSTRPVNPAPPAATSGWVAVGKTGGTFGQINFDGAEGLLRRPPEVASGTTLTARWTVNLRMSNEDVEGGNNPVTRVLQAGECVEPKAAQELRGQVWAEVVVTPCPG